MLDPRITTPSQYPAPSPRDAHSVSEAPLQIDNNRLQIKVHPDQVHTPNLLRVGKVCPSRPSLEVYMHVLVCSVAQIAAERLLHWTIKVWKFIIGIDEKSSHNS